MRYTGDQLTSYELSTGLGLASGGSGLKWIQVWGFGLGILDFEVLFDFKAWRGPVVLIQLWGGKRV